jgi:hypothetical protein
MSFNLNLSSNFSTSNKEKEKRRLSAQEEYWLDRILRNHSTQIFIVLVLLFVSIISLVVFSALYGNTDSTNYGQSNKIEINGANIIISN